MFLFLSAQFESFIDPLIIMLTVPTSTFGGLLPVFLGFGGININIYSQVGLITLVGLITKHGIMMVEFANNYKHHNHKNTKDAIIEAATVRLRPILMTSFTLLLGVIPLVFILRTWCSC